MKRRRWGVSLIELLAVMSGCGVVLSLTAGIIQRTMRSESQTRSFFEVERSLCRLSNQFRRDVHEAVRAADGVAEIDTAGDSQPFLALVCPDGRSIEYVYAGGWIHRTESRQDRKRATEVYRVAAGLRLELKQLPSPRRVILTIERPMDNVVPPSGPTSDAKSSFHQPGAPVDLHVEAVLGGEDRSARGQGPSGGERP